MSNFKPLILWEGDDEFPPEANIIFNDTIGEVLSPEDVAWMAGMLVYRLIALAWSPCPTPHFAKHLPSIDPPLLYPNMSNGLLTLCSNRRQAILDVYVLAIIIEINANNKWLTTAKLTKSHRSWYGYIKFFRWRFCHANSHRITKVPSCYTKSG